MCKHFGPVHAALLFLLIRVSAALPTQSTNFPPITDFGPTNLYGAGVQRSMRLMANSSPERKRTVKVLLYGQSITQELWSIWVGDYLRARYPNANLVITNRAIGYNSELLSRISEYDVNPWYPDLIIYQNYGSTENVEQIVARARRTTTADIILQTDHPLIPADLTEPTDPSTPGGLGGDAWRNYVALPEIANRYGAELADVRTYWKEYLIQQKLAPADVLRDGRHPNLYGDFLMANYIESHLRADGSFSDASWRDAEKQIEIGKDADWNGDTLELPFIGNRVDLVFSGNSDAPLDVLVDGRRPTEFPEVFHFSRPSFYPNTYWPAIMRITSKTPLTNESWTATILESSTNAAGPYVRFSIAGSVTGFDGEGISTSDFVSNSGRVVISAFDWLMLSWAVAYYPALQPLPVGYQITWESWASALDAVTPRLGEPGVESTATVIQQVANGTHRLTLRRHDSGPVPLRAIRIFNPLARVQPQASGLAGFGETHFDSNRVSIQVFSGGPYVIESASGVDGGWRGVTAPITDSVVSLPVSAGQQFFRMRRVD